MANTVRPRTQQRPNISARPLTSHVNGQRPVQPQASRTFNTTYMKSRNVAEPSTQSTPQTAPQALVVEGQEDLTSTMLATAPPQEQKQMLGERLFPLISSMHSDLAGKITGMLLEIDNSELLHMLESKESLTAKV